MVNFIRFVIVFQVFLFIVGGIIAFKRPKGHKFGRMLPRPIKAAISFSMLFTAFIIYNKGITQDYYYGLFVLIGMGFSSLGDLIMCGIIKTPNNLLGGMIAFSIGHINYAIAYGKTIEEKNGHITFLVIWALVIFIFLVSLGCRTLNRVLDKVSKVEIGAVIYGAIIVNMFVFSLFLLVNVGGRYWLTFLAAIIFMVSDSIIALTDIGGKHFEFEGLAVWITYISGQMGIICASLISL